MPILDLVTIECVFMVALGIDDDTIGALDPLQFSKWVCMEGTMTGGIRVIGNVISV